MKSVLTSLAVLVILGFAGSLAHANNWGCQPYGYYPPVQYSGYFPGTPAWNANFAARPPLPFNGLLPVLQPCGKGYCVPGQQQQVPPPIFVTHPFARSPRDFFMYGQNQPDFCR